MPTVLCLFCAFEICVLCTGAVLSKLQNKLSLTGCRSLETYRKLVTLLNIVSGA